MQTVGKLNRTGDRYFRVEMSTTAKGIVWFSGVFHLFVFRRTTSFKELDFFPSGES